LVIGEEIERKQQAKSHARIINSKQRRKKEPADNGNQVFISSTKEN